MNPYDLARQYLNNPYQLEQHLTVARSELRYLLFLQSQKAQVIQQKAQALMHAAETAYRAVQQLLGFKILDTALLETTGFALSAAERTATLLRLLCSVPIQVAQLQSQLSDGGFSQVYKQLKDVGGTIARILQINIDYMQSAEVNFNYVSREQLMQIETGLKQYFRSFNYFQQQMDDWLVKLAPQEALMQVARGYEHFVADYFEILLYQEKIAPRCLLDRGIWYQVALTVNETIVQYFTDFAAERLDLAALLRVLDYYYIMINQIGSYLDRPAEYQLISTYNAQAYAEQKPSVHDFFPIRRIYAVAVHLHVFALLKDYIYVNFRKNEISVSFIVKIFAFVDYYEKMIEKHHFSVFLFRNPIFLKMQQLQTDPPLIDEDTKPFMLVLGQATGSKKMDVFYFYQDQYAKPENTAYVLIPLAERAFLSTFRDFWENKTQVQEKTQILQQFGYRYDDANLIDIEKVFYVNALNLAPATLDLVSNFEETIREKFAGVQRVALKEYAPNLRVCQVYYTNVAADFNTIIQANAITATFSHPQAGQIALAVIKQASAVIVEFSTSVYKMLEVALPHLNYQCFCGQPWRNYFVYSKKCKNAIYAAVLGYHSFMSPNDFQFFKQVDEIPHTPNDFDNLNEHQLVVIANDAYNLYTVIHKITSLLDAKMTVEEALQQQAEEYVYLATKSCIRLIILAMCKFAFLTIYQLPLATLHTAEGENFWAQYRKILTQTIAMTSKKLEKYAQKELRQQLYLTVYAFEFTAFLFGPYPPYPQVFQKNCATIDAIFRELNIKYSDIDRYQRIAQMFVQQKIDNSASFLERCVFTVYAGNAIDQFVTDNMRTIQTVDDFYTDLSALERAIKRFKDG